MINLKITDKETHTTTMFQQAITILKNHLGDPESDKYYGEVLEAVKFLKKGQLGNVNLNEISDIVHGANKNWWIDLETGKRVERNKGELLMLIVTEVAEAMEGARKGIMDDHLPNRRMEEVELADAMIRIFDYCGGFGLDLQGAYEEKMAYNKSRKDHSLAARKAEGGKKF